MFLVQKIIVPVSRRVGQFMRESVFVIERCYRVFILIGIKRNSTVTPRERNLEQGFLMTTSRGVGKIPANPAMLGPRG
jgi:hypothetical protein